MMEDQEINVGKDLKILMEDLKGTGEEEEEAIMEEQKRQ